MDRFDALYLHDNEAFYDQVDPVTEFNLLSVLDDGQSDLAGHLLAALSQFMSQARLVSTLKQPRPEQRVNLHGSRDD
jgi:hypothetical protein